MKYPSFILTACAVVLAFNLQPLLAQQSDLSVKPILGVVVLGKTTLDELKKELQAKGCGFQQSPKFLDQQYVEVNQGCFDLPGNPSIQATSEGASNKPIESLTLKFKFKIATPYAFYETILMKAYGKPTASIEANGMKGAAWYQPEHGLVVIMGTIGSNEQKLAIAYEVGQEAKKHWKELADEWIPEPTKDTSLL